MKCYVCHVNGEDVEATHPGCRHLGKGSIRRHQYWGLCDECFNAGPCPECENEQRECAENMSS